MALGLCLLMPSLFHSGEFGEICVLLMRVTLSCFSSAGEWWAGICTYAPSAITWPSCRSPAPVPTQPALRRPPYFHCHPADHKTRWRLRHQRRPTTVGECRSPFGRKWAETESDRSESDAGGYSGDGGACGKAVCRWAAVCCSRNGNAAAAGWTSDSGLPCTAAATAGRRIWLHCSRWHTASRGNVHIVAALTVRCLTLTYLTGE